MFRSILMIAALTNLAGATGAGKAETFPGKAARSGTYKRPLLDVGGKRYELKASGKADASVAKTLARFSKGDTGRYTITGTLTDLMVRPDFAKHDGFYWKVELAHDGDTGKKLAAGGPVGDGHGRPDSATFKIEKTSLRPGELIRLVIHPNRWWGTDMTRIEDLRIERLDGPR